MKVYPLRIAPILTIFTQNESSWRDLSFETHFVFRWFFSCRAVDGCSVDGRRMIFGRPFSHDKIRWISKIQISNFKFQISNFNWPGLGRDGSDGRNGTDGPQPWPIEIWNFKILSGVVRKRSESVPKLSKKVRKGPKTVQKQSKNGPKRSETVRNGPKTIRNRPKLSENDPKPSETVRKRSQIDPKSSETVRKRSETTPKRQKLLRTHVTANTAAPAAALAATSKKSHFTY